MKSFFALTTMLLLISWLVAVECPFGMVNDPFPGSCGRYVDKNGDGICDLSEQPIKESQEKTTTPSNQPEQKIPETKKEEFKDYYNFILISLATIISYSISWLLSFTKKIKESTHKFFWNVILLISFKLSALLAILWLLKTSFGINSISPAQASFWHVETGIVMIWVGAFHALWHTKYYKVMIARKKEN